MRADRQVPRQPAGRRPALFRWPATETAISAHCRADATCRTPINVRGWRRRCAPQGRRDRRDGDGRLRRRREHVLARSDADPANAADRRRRTASISWSATCATCAGGWAHEDDAARRTRSPSTPSSAACCSAPSVTGAAARPRFHHGFSRAIGGGEYERSRGRRDAGARRSASRRAALQPHLDALAAPADGCVIEDSLTYAQTPVLQGRRRDGRRRPGARRRGRGAQRRPAADRGRGDVCARDRRARHAGARRTGDPRRRTARSPPPPTLEPRELVLRHCTLVPGPALDPDGSAVSPAAPSLVDRRIRSRSSRWSTASSARCAWLHGDTRSSSIDCIVDAGRADVAYEGIAAAPGDTPAGASSRSRSAP